MNIGGAGSYVYGDPANEAPAAVSMETDRKPEEEKKAPARGPVKGEKYGEEKEQRCVGKIIPAGKMSCVDG